MSNYLIALIAILVFLAVLFVLWRGGRLSIWFKDIFKVEADGGESGKADRPTQPEDKRLTMTMKASGEGSAILGSKQTVSGSPGDRTKMDMSAEGGGMIVDGEQSSKDEKE